METIKKSKTLASKRPKHYSPHDNKSNSIKILNEMQLIETQVHMADEEHELTLMASPKKSPELSGVEHSPDGSISLSSFDLK